MTTYDSLHRAFNPRSIALLGVNARPGDVGRVLLRNMVGSSYEGAVFPVSPRLKSLMGMKVYASLKQIPDPVDLAIIATPPESVPDLIRECGDSGIRTAIVVSAGFQQTGKPGIALKRKLAKAGIESKVRIIGPNCLGFLRPSIGLNASFAKDMALDGNIAFISQSRALASAVLDWSIQENVGFSHFISIGSMADVSYHELIDYLGQDPNTSSILIYMETIKDVRSFMSAARSIGKTKPIIVLKVGRSPEGAQAVASHSGSLSGDDAVFDALFRRVGIARVNTVKQLFNVAQALSSQPTPKGKKLLVVTNAGGPGIIATDSHIRRGGSMAKLSKRSVESLSNILPAAWSRSNPVDILGDADANRYREAIRICSQEEEADGLLVILTPQEATNVRQVAREIGRLSTEIHKPVLAAFMGADAVESGVRILAKHGIPAFDSPEEAVSCFDTIAQYRINQRQLTETPSSIPRRFKPKTEQARSIVRKAIEAGETTLNEYDSKHLLSRYDIHSAPHQRVFSPAQAARAAAKLGFPVALKALSPDIQHKTDVGGIRLHIRSQRAVSTAYKEILEDVKKHAPEAQITGMLVEKMATKKYELFIGCKRDPLCGPVIVFGMGGLGVEVFQDIAVGIPPLNMVLAKRMIESTKIYKLLSGYRGMKAIDLKSLQFLLYRFSYVIMDIPEIREIDVNPIAVDESGSVVLDAKIALDPKTKVRKSDPYSHLIISPYPKNWEKRVRTKNGKRVLLRPIRPEDESLEAEMFRAMSEETQRFRFFHFIKDITHEMLVRYTQIDYDREIAIVAELSDKGTKMAGVARIISDPYNDTAEFAVVVADPWHGMGIGKALTDHVIDIAKQRKVKKIYAHFLPDNYIIRGVFEKRGFTITRDSDAYSAALTFA